MKPEVYLVSGVCGVGKSTIIPHLKNLLPNEKYDIRDFDERGVPDGADREWRKAELKKWLEIGAQSAQKGITTIICGFVKTVDLDGLLSEHGPEVEIILLDADAGIVRRRLVNRYTKEGVFDENQKVIGKPINEFIEGNVYYCDIMRKECEEEGCKIIDTSNLVPEEVAQKVSDLIK